MKLLSTLCVAAIAVPFAAAQGGDDCTQAQAIAGFGTFPFDNTNATGSGIADCNGLGVRKDVWFEWTSPFTGLVRYETCNTTTGFDTRIAAYSGTCNSLNFLGCASNTCMGLSRMSFDAVAGQTYLLRPGSRPIGAGGPGEIRLDIDPCPPSLDDGLEDNDDCASAVTVGNGTLTNLWCSKTDPDWYTTCIPAGGVLQIDLFFTNNTGDIDMFCFEDCDLSANLGIGGSGTDDEQVIIDNSTGTTDLTCTFRVELWISDANNECNFYDMSITGAGGACAPPGGIGTNYCMANANSTGNIAPMAAMGSDVAADNDVTLMGSLLPANSFSFFLTSLTSGFVANPAGSAGNLCVLGQIGRYVGPGQIQQADAAGDISLTIDLTQVPQPNGFVSVAAGETWFYQAWYRDQVGGMATSNFTDGLAITYL